MIVGASAGRWCAGALVACSLVAPRAAAAQSLGSPCTTPGELAWSGFLLACSESGTFRYALHDDITPTRIQGLVAIQVNGDGALGVEVMPGAEDPAAFRGFTAAKRTYRR